MAVALAAMICVLTIGGTAAEAAPIVERFGEATVDFSAGTVEVRGAAAPGLRTPTAQVARVEAERAARADAGRRLVKALGAMGRARLGCDDAARLPEVEAAAQAAAVRDIEWGSDGSVRLVLRVEAAALAKQGSVASAPPDGGAAPDAGAPAATGKIDKADKKHDRADKREHRDNDIVVLDPKAEGALFDGGSCATARPAPPLYATAADARAAGRAGEVMKAAKVAKLAKKRIVAVVRSER